MSGVVRTAEDVTDFWAEALCARVRLQVSTPRLPVTYCGYRERNLLREGFDLSGGFDPSNQAERHHEKDGNEARCPKNAGDGPMFACSIHEHPT